MTAAPIRRALLEAAEQARDGEGRVIGRREGRWVIAPVRDTGAVAEMQSPTFVVAAYGLVDPRQDRLFEALEQQEEREERAPVEPIKKPGGCQVNLIAAVGRRGQLGLNGKLPWHDPGDLAWFRKMTMGGVVLVGRNTSRGLPELPGRAVVIDNSRLETPEETLASVWLAYGAWSTVWIAGGAKTYSRYMHLVDRYYLSQINYDGDADVWMPPLGWQAAVSQ